MFPERISNLPEYAFPRLRALLDSHKPGGAPAHMTIGEPKHPFPAWITDVITEHAHEFGNYPANEGTPELRQSITDWVNRRYGVILKPDDVIVFGRPDLVNFRMKFTKHELKYRVSAPMLSAQTIRFLLDTGLERFEVRGPS